MEAIYRVGDIIMLRLPMEFGPRLRLGSASRRAETMLPTIAVHDTSCTDTNVRTACSILFFCSCVIDGQTENAMCSGGVIVHRSTKSRSLDKNLQVRAAKCVLHQSH